MSRRTLTNRRDRRNANQLPAAHLILLLDYERPRHPSSRHRLDGIEEVLVGRGDHDTIVRTDRTLAIEIADLRMSQRHARLSFADQRWRIEDRGSRNGTFVVGVRVDRCVLGDGALIEVGRNALLLRTMEPVGSPDLDASALVSPIGDIVTFSPSFTRALANLARVALTRQNIVLHGETGTGKEVLARGIHVASRRPGAFVAVNCGALPDTLVESELYGYRKGAFSGATEDRPGLIRSADQGTLFLDEIGDLPLATQGSLLRVLQEREVTPLGATKPVSIDLRVIAASHRDLEQEVKAGRFRDDLLARLAGYVMRIPAVRERREDLGLLIAALLANHNADAIRFAPEAGSALLRYRWPRNVRELEQVLGSATALATDHTIELEHLPPGIQHPAAASTEDDLSPSELQRRDQLRTALAKHQGNIAAVGRELGVARMQIHRWLDSYGIDIDDYRP